LDSNQQPSDYRQGDRFGGESRASVALRSLGSFATTHMRHRGDLLGLAEAEEAWSAALDHLVSGERSLGLRWLYWCLQFSGTDSPAVQRRRLDALHLFAPARGCGCGAGSIHHPACSLRAAV